MEFHVFISHASEDKDDFVRPLASKLKQLGLDVWYDEFSLKPGDGLRQSIDRGLRNSNYGIVVLSQSFFDKSWTEWELNGLVQRHLSEGGNVIIPIWHGVDAEMVMSYSPSLADIVAVTSKHGVVNVAEQIYQVVSPLDSSDDVKYERAFFSDKTRNSEGFRFFQKQLTKTLQELVAYISSSLELKNPKQELRLTLFVLKKCEDQINLIKVGSSIDKEVELVIPAKSTMVGYGLVRKIEISVTNTESIADRYFSRPLTENLYRSMMAIPIVINHEMKTKKVLGVLSMDASTPDFFREKNEKFFNSLVKLIQNILASQLCLYIGLR